MANRITVKILNHFWSLMIICGVIYLMCNEWTKQPKVDQIHTPTNKHQGSFDRSQHKSTEVSLQTSDDGYKKILYWNKFFSFFGYKFGFGRKPFVDWCTTAAGFTHQRCETTSNRSQLDSSDAVVFHITNLRFDDLPEKRRPEQVWIFFLTESPAYTFIANDKREKLNGIFNWTMTHRRDSDIPNDYFIVQRKTNKDLENNVTNILKGEKGLVAWLTSRCQSSGKREKYVEQLKKYIPIDVYGKCGNTCPGKTRNECLDFVFSHYKFYLSFENSLCNDYVTEKLSNPLERGVVPIVYGGADYNATAPPNSFINTKDFESPQRLAEYIKLLNSNDELYLNYFQWRHDYKVSVIPQLSFCHVCDRLHQMDMGLSSNHKVYDDMVSWWYTKGNCHGPRKGLYT